MKRIVLTSYGERAYRAEKPTCCPCKECGCRWTVRSVETGRVIGGKLKEEIIESIEKRG